MEGLLMVYVSLQSEFMGTKYNVYIHSTEQKRTSSYSTNMSIIDSNKSIQHISTDSLKQNELVAYYMAISEKQKDRQTGKSLRVGASQVV